MTESSARVPRLLAIGNRRQFDGASNSLTAIEAWEQWLRELADDRVDGVLLREKDLDDLELFAFARVASALRQERRAPNLLLISGRADLALAADLDGTHLPADEIPAALLRQRFGSRLLLGRSTHHPDEVAAARKDGVDYVTFGPVFATPSKARYGDPPGLAGLEQAARQGLPVLALGGMMPENLARAAAAGAAGVAAIRAFADPVLRRQMVETAETVWGRHQPAIRCPQ